MSQTKQQEQGAAQSKPRVRKDWELFWRIIAGLMLVIIVWIIWVLYQITPRSVVTPLAYEHQLKPIGTQPSATDAAGTIASPQPTAAAPAAQTGAAADTVTEPSPEAAAAAVTMDQAQAGARTGAHQSAADVQAATQETGEEQLKQEQQFRRKGLKLSTELATPPVEKETNPKKQ